MTCRPWSNLALLLFCTLIRHTFLIAACYATELPYPGLVILRGSTKTSLGSNHHLVGLEVLFHSPCPFCPKTTRTGPWSAITFVSPIFKNSCGATDLKQSNFTYQNAVQDFSHCLSGHRCCKSPDLFRLLARADTFVDMIYAGPGRNLRFWLHFGGASVPVGHCQRSKSTRFRRGERYCDWNRTECRVCQPTGKRNCCPAEHLLFL